MNEEILQTEEEEEEVEVEVEVKNQSTNMSAATLCPTYWKFVMGVEEDDGVRPCDSCVERRARWFCAADDAYLCHACDTSVHTANSLSCRHSRLPLPPPQVRILLPDSCTSWHRKRSRSCRSKQYNSNNLLREDVPSSSEQKPGKIPELPNIFTETEAELSLDDLQLGLCINCNNSNAENGVVKHADELFDLNIDISDLMEEEDANVNVNLNMDDCYFSSDDKGLCLRLNYDDVLTAWSDRGSLWADQKSLQTFLEEESIDQGSVEYGVVPEFKLVDEMVEGEGEKVPAKMEGKDGHGQYQSSCGREARVMRYREKRQSRLFSKQIRYQVRKLNAEKRPRMKGRFVKRVADV